MKFRFGWRKERKEAKQMCEILNEVFESEAKEDLPAKGVTAPARILFFGDHEEAGSLYSLFLRSKGYEVLHFSSPATCALINKQMCRCPRDHVCADMMIADMGMEGMTGLELIRHQNERGCRAFPEQKAVISKGLTFKQEHEAAVLGCKTLLKPFRLMDMMEWVKKCEENIPSGRKLTPIDEMMDTV